MQGWMNACPLSDIFESWRKAEPPFPETSGPFDHIAAAHVSD